LVREQSEGSPCRARASNRGAACCRVARPPSALCVPRGGKVADRRKPLDQRLAGMLALARSITLRGQRLAGTLAVLHQSTSTAKRTGRQACISKHTWFFVRRRVFPLKREAREGGHAWKGMFLSLHPTLREGRTSYSTAGGHALCKPNCKAFPCCGPARRCHTAKPTYPPPLKKSTQDPVLRQ